MKAIKQKQRSEEYELLRETQTHQFRVDGEGSEETAALGHGGAPECRLHCWQANGYVAVNASY